MNELKQKWDQMGKLFHNCDSYVNQKRKSNILYISCQFSCDENGYGSINLGLILERYLLKISI